MNIEFQDQTLALPDSRLRPEWGSLGGGGVEGEEEAQGSTV